MAVPVMDAGVQVVAYLDIRKAFVTIDNDILLIKLDEAGWTPKLLNFE